MKMMSTMKKKTLMMVESVVIILTAMGLAMVRLIPNVMQAYQDAHDP